VAAGEDDAVGAGAGADPVGISTPFGITS